MEKKTGLAGRPKYYYLLDIGPTANLIARFITGHGVRQITQSEWQMSQMGLFRSVAVCHCVN